MESHYVIHGCLLVLLSSSSGVEKTTMLTITKYGLTIAVTMRTKTRFWLLLVCNFTINEALLDTYCERRSDGSGANYSATWMQYIHLQGLIMVMLTPVAIPQMARL
jgi:hypothetical protein